MKKATTGLQQLFNLDNPGNWIPGLSSKNLLRRAIDFLVCPCKEVFGSDFLFCRSYWSLTMHAQVLTHKNIFEITGSPTLVTIVLCGETTTSKSAAGLKPYRYLFNLVYYFFNESKKRRLYTGSIFQIAECKCAVAIYRYTLFKNR